MLQLQHPAQPKVKLPERAQVIQRWNFCRKERCDFPVIRLLGRRKRSQIFYLQCFLLDSNLPTGVIYKEVLQTVLSYTLQNFKR